MKKDFESSNYLDSAIDAARKAGKLLIEGMGSGTNKIDYKGEIDIVTEMDCRSEELIKTLLQKRFPEISILAEESGDSGGYSRMRWIIDPLDGTTSYAHNIPHFSISIALEKDGEIVAGVVYNPCLDECFYAGQGTGAYLNGKLITVSTTRALKKSLLATGFPYDRATSDENNLDHFGAFLLKVQGIRRMGSAALDLSYTAAGRFDGYWEMKLAPWDVAAGSIILKEAGGKVTDFSLNPFNIYGKEILASNGLIHNEMTKILKGVVISGCLNKESISKVR